MTHPARLRWLCRRGMKELDLLLLGYLENVYPTAGAKEQAAFESLLEMPDPDLYSLVTGKSQADDELVARVIDVLRGTLTNGPCPSCRT